MRRSIYTSDAPEPIGPYSQAVLVDEKTMYVSGQIPIDAATGLLVKGSVEEQTHQVMKNIKAILLSEGMSFSQVVKVSIFVTDMSFFTQVNQVYGSYFQDVEIFPARETIQVAALPKQVNVEISCIAVK